MRLYISITLLISLTSCLHDNSSNSGTVQSPDENRDTLLLKRQNVLNKSYEVGFLSRSFSYFWVAGKDTIDFFINVSEYEKDSTFHLNIHHRKPLLFTTMLEHINESLPIIRKDFDISKFSSIYFRSPIYYLDLAKKLSTEYKKKFDKNDISYQRLNEFLMNSSLNSQLDIFLDPLNKKVKRYSIEKFHLLDKPQYSYNFPDTDLTDYPEFTIAGMGVSIQLESK